MIGVMTGAKVLGARLRSMMPFWVAAAMVWHLMGCMVHPGDGKRISSTSDSIQFSGYTLGDGSEISVEAYNFNTNTWNVVATTAADVGMPISAMGFDWYGWKTHKALPAQYWRNAPSGHGKYARVRSRNVSVDATHYSMRANDSTACLLSHLGDSGTKEFIDDCTSHRNPEAYIYTNDYEHGSPSCSPGPSVSKDHYDVREIPACKRADIAALINGKISNSFVKTHHDRSFIDHGARTGPNSFFRGHREYVRQMQNHLSVYGEKWLPDGRLPFWNPATGIPSHFTGIPYNSANCMSNSSGCSGWFQSSHANLSPNLPRPTSIQTSNICSSNPSIHALFTNLVPWHDNVHNTVGGSGSTFASYDSPAATIFWPWHKYVDDIYSEWKACGIAEPQ